MNLLFINGGSRLKKCEDGSWYTDPNFTAEVWYRYRNICSSLHILLRREPKIYDKKYAEKNFNKVLEGDNIKVTPLADLTNPKANFMNFMLRQKVRRQIFEAVKRADKVIIRSNTIYTHYCYNACKKFKKPYLFEVTGFSYEGLLYNNNVFVKCLAPYMEYWQKKLAKNASYTIYVTDYALQKRYTSKGKMFACSDVSIGEIDNDVLQKKLNNLKKHREVIKIGTCGRIGDFNKGQHLVIKALGILKNQNILNFCYEMVGFGDSELLHTLIKETGLEDKVVFVGGKSHSEMMDWYDDIDIYIQPSYSEGLSRAIVEAMSRACPVICSNVGGNNELISDKYLFRRGDYKQLADKLKLIITDLSQQAEANFNNSKKYQKEILDIKRQKILNDYANE